MVWPAFRPATLGYMLKRHEEARSKAFETLGGQGLSLSEELLNNPKAFQAVLEGRDPGDRHQTRHADDTSSTVRSMLRAASLAQQTIRAYGGRFLSFDRGDGRLRSRFEQIGASTGRLSSHSPNLQSRFLLRTKHAMPSARRLGGSLSSPITPAVSFGSWRK